MTKRMLVDATHPEETRVVLVNGNKLEDFDFEVASKKQLKGNIYLAKVVRIEPSLQAAFVEYGGNRHGFLAFSEIHPDYFHIPPEERALLLASSAAERDDEDEDEAAEPAETAPDAEAAAPAAAQPETFEQPTLLGPTAETAEAPVVVDPLEGMEAPIVDDTEGDADTETDAEAKAETAAEAEPEEETATEEEAAPRQRRARSLRSYKIQDVIKRRQVLLIQVNKEERGNKGAALTTYLSLPGRYCVLMPNTPRGGGISRKITNPQDRKRMKDIISDLDVPDGMAVILRTAGLEQAKAEIKRDCDYLLRLWDTIREEALRSVAPKLIYEEANLIKRSIRDLYANDIDDIFVEGEAGYQAAREFMKMLMPSDVKKIQPYRDPMIPLFTRFQVESQIDAIHSPVVQLKSGGYLVINPTEALVAIDVNSGRATKERNIEETALRTNSEAADEIGRQLRLRDLAGLIVVDFIDMEEGRNNAAIERRMKEALKNDRARVQVGRISPFGLLELSRQRMRPSLLETHFEVCPHCGGLGHVRSINSAALYVLRGIEEEGARRRSSEVTVSVSSRVALYILNQKRAALNDIERRYSMRVIIQADDTQIQAEYRLERSKTRAVEESDLPVTAESVMAKADQEAEGLEDQVDEPAEAEGEETSPTNNAATDTRDDRRNRTRNRRRRRGRRDDRGDETAVTANADNADDAAAPVTAQTDETNGAEIAAVSSENGQAAAPAATTDEDDNNRRRRHRGRRNNGRYDQPRDAVAAPVAAPVAVPVGVTPYDTIEALFAASEEAYEAPAVSAPIAPMAPEAPRAVTETTSPANETAEKATETATEASVPPAASTDEKPATKRAPRRRATKATAEDADGKPAEKPRRAAPRRRKENNDDATAPTPQSVPSESAPVTTAAMAPQAAAPAVTVMEAPTTQAVTVPTAPTAEAPTAPTATPSEVPAGERRKGWWSK